MESIFPVIFSLMMAVPNVLVWLIGIILAVSRWRRHPRVSQISVVAFVIMIVITIISRFLNALLPMAMHDRGWTSDQIGSIFTVVGAITTLTSAVVWALVLWAIFGWRNGQQQQFVPASQPSFVNDQPGPSATT
jgi:hypothetical protein